MFGYPKAYYSFVRAIEKKFSTLKRFKYSSAVFGESTIQKMLYAFISSDKYDFFHNLKITKESKILDVGCGNGAKFLFPLAEIGIKNLLGCDPFIQEPIKYNNGLEIRKTTIFGIDGNWDIITYNHSFEHIENPQENMRKIYELLSPNGICVIRIPIVSSYAWEHYKTNWYQLDAPRHFFLHSIKSMEMLAINAYLKLYKYEYDSTYKQYSESERYLRDISLLTPLPKGIAYYISRKIQKLNYQKLTKELNKNHMGDQAIFYLRKINPSDKIS
jgi:2-polyprenyl-3-methyl-5-hydroxy-6-metoxy-1,4-benzoquinol methylase